jgi:hypothetical protein
MTTEPQPIRPTILYASLTPLDSSLSVSVLKVLSVCAFVKPSPKHLSTPARYPPLVLSVTRTRRARRDTPRIVSRNRSRYTARANHRAMEGCRYTASVSCLQTGGTTLICRDNGSTSWRLFFLTWDVGIPHGGCTWDTLNIAIQRLGDWMLKNE